MKTGRRWTLMMIMVCLGFWPELYSQSALKSYLPLIEKGEFTKAQEAIRKKLASHPEMDHEDRLILEFEIERLDRIRMDFRKTKTDILQYIRNYMPEATEKDLNRWEEEKSLEAMIIDGRKWYFNRSAPNLFRIDRMAKAIKEAYEGDQPVTTEVGYDFKKDAEQIIHAAETLKQSLVKPRRFHMTYTLTVDADAVPAGEVIRAWLPYPREGHPRQRDIEFLDSEPEDHILSPQDLALHRSIYMEKKSVEAEPTVFQVVFKFTSYSQFVDIDPGRVQPYSSGMEWMEQYIAEKPPHIVFTDALKAISREIVGEETNPFLKAQKIFEWIDAYSPWAGAREYSTMRNIPMYVVENKHGDCGMQTLLFITLARLNGIPTHWQSGWWLAPGEKNLHDWCEIYMEPYGWVLVDQDIGLLDTEDPQVRWFNLGSTVPWRWIVNEDFSAHFYPAKIHPRSETVDFQRGEVEWRGGNLYFDKWGYRLNIEVLE